MKNDELNKPHTQTTESKEVKSKILSRIQQQLNRKAGDESMTYMKHDEHNKVNQYLKAPLPTLSDPRVTPLSPFAAFRSRNGQSGIPKLNPEFRTNL